MSLSLRPIGTREASDVVKRLHRHLPRVVGGLFAVACYDGDELVGVGVASVPKAPASRDGFTVEISRVATDGHRNACSKIYGALGRACKAIGVRRIVTFTRMDEPGTSLLASGFRFIHVTREQSWDRPKKPREKQLSQVRKWERILNGNESSVDSDDAPIVCPGCYAVGPEPCAPGCIDAEIAQEREDAMLYRSFDDVADEESSPC